MLIASKSQVEIERLKAQLHQEFEMKDLGEAKKILGMEINRDRKKGKLCLTQSRVYGSHRGCKGSYLVTRFYLNLKLVTLLAFGAELTELSSLLTEPLKKERQEGSLSHLSTSVGEVANLLQRSRKEASVVEVEAEAEDEVEAVVMDEVGILTAATSTTTRKEKAQQEAAGEAIQTRGMINLKEEPSLTIEVRVSSSSAIPLIQKVTSYTTRTTKSL
ncbi:hypothetical protein ACOSP7_011171 [Xanthoceras sorbifolium]